MNNQFLIIELPQTIKQTTIFSFQDFLQANNVFPLPKQLENFSMLPWNSHLSPFDFLSLQRTSPTIIFWLGTCVLFFKFFSKPVMSILCKIVLINVEHVIILIAHPLCHSGQGLNLLLNV